MRSLGSRDVQRALYLRLRRAMPDANIFDAVPEDQAFPYIVIGDDRSEDESGKNFFAASVVVTITILSRADGFDEAKILADLVVDAIAEAPLEVEGMRVVSQTLEGHDTARDNEDRRLELRFRLRLFER